MAPGAVVLLSILPSLIFSRQIVTTDLVPVLVIASRSCSTVSVRVPNQLLRSCRAQVYIYAYQFDHSYQPQLQ